MNSEFAISKYPDARRITRQLDELIRQPIWTIRPDALKQYETEYFDKKCPKSKAMIEDAKKIIPGGVQHNLAFNHPFPIAIEKAEGAYLYDVDGNRYYDFLQAGGPTVLGSNPKEVREQVFRLLEECGPSTGLFHEYEYKLAKKITECVGSVEMFRMLGSGTEACMAAIRVARLATKNKNILKMGGAYHGWSDQLAYGIRIPGSRATQASGVPKHIFKQTQEFFPNDLDDLEKKLKNNKLHGGTAAVLIEPVGPESGTRPLDFEFNKGVESLCRTIRRAADLRRGGDRIPDRNVGSPGLFRGLPRSHRIRKGHRGRLPRSRRAGRKERGHGLSFNGHKRKREA